MPAALIFWERMVGVRAEVEKVYDLYIAGGIGVEQFKEINTPLHDRLGQISAELPKLEGETAPLAVSDLSVETIAHEARNIAALWSTLDTDGKQRLASTLCTGIIIPDKGPEAPIEITFAHSASQKVEAPIRIGAASEPVEPDSSENFPEISKRRNSQRQPLGWRTKRRWRCIPSITRCRCFLPHF